jgi:hypothetical protein
MSKKCFFCYSKLNNYSIDSNLLINKYWNNEYYKSNYNIYFYNKNIFTCIHCGIQYAKWIYYNFNKIHYLNYKKIGIKKYLSFPLNLKKTRDFDYCINCNKNTFIPIDTPINQRHNYIESFGQLCNNCSL